MVENQRGVPSDLMANVSLLALLQLSSLFFVPRLVPTVGMITISSLVFGIGATFVSMCVLFRLWQLVARDGGPAYLVIISVAAFIASLVYSAVWNLLTADVASWSGDAALVSRIGQHGPLVLRTAGFIALGFGLLGWSRVERWVGWTLIGYASVLCASIPIVRWWSPLIISPLINWTWLAVLIALLLGLVRIRDGADRAEVAAQP